MNETKDPTWPLIVGVVILLVAAVVALTVLATVARFIADHALGITLGAIVITFVVGVLYYFGSKEH